MIFKKKVDFLSQKYIWAQFSSIEKTTWETQILSSLISTFNVLVRPKSRGSSTSSYDQDRNLNLLIG